MRRWQRAFVTALLGSVLLLSGCVDYDAGIRFDGLHGGAIVQQVRLGERLTSFSRAQATAWLDSIERRARQLGGRTEQASPLELSVTIPFGDGPDLERKFNRFFHPDAETSSDLVAFDAVLELQQSNLLLAQRTALRLDLDLRALGVLSPEAARIVDAASLVDLDFWLEVPGDLQAEGARREGSQVAWTLQPGKVNTLRATFWLPEPIGIGAAAIALFCLGGFYLKYRCWPWQQSVSE